MSQIWINSKRRSDNPDGKIWKKEKWQKLLEDAAEEKFIFYSARAGQLENKVFIDIWGPEVLLSVYSFEIDVTVVLSADKLEKTEPRSEDFETIKLMRKTREGGKTWKSWMSDGFKKRNSEKLKRIH
jgi:hypothetical protein